MIKIVTKLKNIKENFLLKNPYQKWSMVRSAATFFLKMVGCHVTDPNYKKTIVTGIPVYFGISFFVLLFYTIYYYRHKPLKALEPTPMISIMFPVGSIQF